MTPLVRHFVSMVPDPESMHWFDVGAMPTEIVYLSIDDDLTRLVSRLPFDVCALCFVDAQGEKTFLRLTQGVETDGKTSITAAGLVLDKQGRSHIVQPVAYLVSDAGIALAEKRDAHTPLQPIQDTQRKEQALAVLLVLRRFLSGLDAKASEAYAVAPKKSFVNTRRAAKGLPPAIWTWRTIRVEPRPAMPNDAAPQQTRGLVRAHDRRGHWRRLSETHIVWVRPCRVGNPALGESLHDYRIA